MPPHCTLEPGSNRVAVDLRDISSKSITIQRAVVDQLQQAKVVPKIQKVHVSKE